MGAMVGVAIAVHAASMAQAQARRERYWAMTPEQRKAYDATQREAEMLKDKTRAARMFKAATKSSTDCPWKRFRKGTQDL